MINNTRYWFCSTGYNNVVSTLMPVEIKQTLIAVRSMGRYHYHIANFQYVIIDDHNICDVNCTIAENLTEQDITALKLTRDIFITEITEPFKDSYTYDEYTVLPNIHFRLLSDQCRKHFGITIE